LPSTRRALSAAELTEINQVVAAGGRDPILNTLLIRLHIETACRRGGALMLRLSDLDTRYCRVLLRERGGTYRWQPISSSLTATLPQRFRLHRGPHLPVDRQRLSLMDAIESGIVKVPRTPVDDDADHELVTYLRLWDFVGGASRSRAPQPSGTFALPRHHQGMTADANASSSRGMSGPAGW
jgi:integrase